MFKLLKVSPNIKSRLDFDSFKNGHFLLALSGGVDSIALFHLLLHHQISFGAAHVNFGLRESDSDFDQTFVEGLCEKHKIRLHKKRVQPDDWVKRKNSSTQAQAREIRYQWFEKLMNENHYSGLMSGHHLDDQLETFLINLSRGTGIDGLCGISDDIITRPLLPLSKEEIYVIAEENNWEWREDKSNQEDKYLRNFIRNQITPNLKKTHPHFLDNFRKSLTFLRSDKEMLKTSFQEKFKSTIKCQNQGIIHIDISKLSQEKNLEHSLFWWFKPYGFDHPKELIKLLSAEKGKEIQSKTHRIIMGEDEWLLCENKNESLSNDILANLSSLDKYNLKSQLSDKRDSNADASFDFDLIEFPLRLNGKEIGDTFIPLGMQRFKKVGKYMRDQKKNKIETERLGILRNGNGDILWLLGERIDDRYKVTSQTKNVLNIYLKN